MKDKINTFGKSMVFLIGIIAVSLFLAPFIRTNSEGFSGFLSPGYFPKSVNQVILDEFPQIGKNMKMKVKRVKLLMQEIYG